MNYTIEDNLDFKSALFDDSDLDSIDNNMCLISQQKLTKSHITLPCEHKFNYMPLYNEIYRQKQKNLFEVCNLKVNQIKCPYCRTVFDKFLPYIPSECVLKTHGVNYPFKYGMENTVKCDNVKCTKVAQYIGANGMGANGMGANEMGANEIDTNSYCKTHYLKNKSTQIESAQIESAQIESAQIESAQIESAQIEWTNDMNIMFKVKTVTELKELLRLHKLKVGGTKRTLIERIFENKLNSN